MTSAKRKKRHGQGRGHTRRPRRPRRCQISCCHFLASEWWQGQGVFQAQSLQVLLELLAVAAKICKHKVHKGELPKLQNQFSFKSLELWTPILLNDFLKFFSEITEFSPFFTTVPHLCRTSEPFPASTRCSLHFPRRRLRSQQVNCLTARVLLKIMD